MTVGPGWVEPQPDAYEAANGMEAATPGAPDNWITRDPTSDTVDGSISNSEARQAAFSAQLEPQGGNPGWEVVLPDPYTPNEGA